MIGSYATAKDEVYAPPSQRSFRTSFSPLKRSHNTAKQFEIAMEETEKVSVYAEEDRKAAREELENLKTAFSLVTQGSDRELAEEVKRRVGHRIRELENAVVNMEELAMHQD